jgi:hypothetical protein
MNESENLLNRPKTGQMLKHLLPSEEHEYFYEKFAELIVEECARIVTRDAASVIFEHFDLEY